ncbi:MAG: TonB-dependent receptor [Carboxylicivirga sp.]|nr:TonB-dependent receptor [Carboxylicivirga sp.]
MKKNWKQKPYLERAWLRKLWLIMKTAFVFLFMTMVQVSASVYSQDTKLTLKMQNATIEQVIKEIKQKSEFDFVFDYDLIENTRAVSINAKNAGVEEILNECLKETNLNYKIVDKVILLLPALKHPVIQEELKTITVKGIVKDEKGELLPGATIIIQGTTQGVITGINGDYHFPNVPVDAVLKCSFIGFADQELPVNGQTTIDWVLKSAVSELEDITVVGFGTQKKDAVVGSMSTVKPAELKVPSSNLTTALAGRISGVISYQTSGEPGQDNAQFFIRGITSFAQGTQPLILIDGVELTSDDLARLNPDDIESFSVMKDATSTAVYGARGANGVIYVTTKKGVEGKPKLNIRYESSFSTNTMLPDIADGVTYMQKKNEAVKTWIPGALAPFSEEKIYNTIHNVNPNVFPNVDWQDELIKDWTHNRRFNASLSGGGKKIRYYLATSFAQDNGILKDDPLGYIESNIKLRKYSVRSNIDIDLTPTTTAVVRLHSTFDEYKGPVIGGGALFAQTLLTSPVRFPAVYDPDENNVNTPHILFGNQLRGEGEFYINPYQQLLSGYTQNSRSLNLVQFEMRQKLDFITEGLSVRFLGNNNRTSFYGLSRSNSPFFYEAKLVDYDPIENSYVLTRLNEDGNRALSFGGGDSNVVNVLYGELAADYHRNFGDHTINAMLVGIIRESNNSAAESLIASLPYRNLGVSGRFTYDYKTKYFAEFNFGYNGSERFAENNRFGFFPSVGVGWLVSKEKFFENVNPNFINKVKLKASYGLVGNDQIGAKNDRFFYRSQVGVGQGYMFGDRESYDYVNGVSILNYANDEITWEIAETTNFGLELDFMQSAFQLRAEYFIQDRSNILQSRLLPYSMGLRVTADDGSSVRDNVGSARINGVDLSLDGNKSWMNGMWLSVRGTFTYSNSEITNFEEPNYALQNSPYRAITGSKIGQAYGYVAERLFLDDQEVINSPRQVFGTSLPSAGDIKYKDINGDGEINTLDMVPIGHPQSPQMTFGAGFSAGYKDFDFSIFFQGNANVSMFINPGTMMPFIEGYDKDLVNRGNPGKTYMYERALLQEFADNHWSEDNANPYAEFPRLSPGINANNMQTSSYWMRDGSFVRLKQLELGYNIRNIKGISNIRIYASGTNLFTWSKFKLWDPELGGNGMQYPVQRVFNLGLSVNL